MGQTSVAQFASELGLPAELLLEQLKGAGVNKSADADSLTEQDKTLLLEYLRKEHGAQEPKNKITLTRKQVTEIKKSDSTGKNRTIQVEVRKKRVLVRRDPSEEAAEQQAIEEQVIAPVIEEVIEPVAEVLAVEEAVVEVELPPVVQVEEPIQPEIVVEAAAPVVAEKGTLKKSVLSADQIAKREDEARRQSALVALQTEEIRKKQELQQRRVEEEAKKVAAAAEAAAPTKLSEVRCISLLPKRAQKPKTKPKKLPKIIRHGLMPRIKSV